MFNAGGKRLARIRRISRIVNVLCWLAMAAILCGLPLFWIGFSYLLDQESLFFIELEIFSEYGPLPNPMPRTSLMAGFAIMLIPASLLVFALDRLRRLFGLYAQGVIFSAGNSRYLRGFALSVIVLQLIKPLVDGFLSVALTWGNPSGVVKLKMSFGSGEITMIFVGMVFLVIAWIMELGNEVAEEQAQIV